MPGIFFTAWQQAGAPAKDNWAFLALSLFGDESTARDLTTLILAWPQEGKSARAVSGLNILTQMNNDMALIQLHHISQRAKSRPLRDNAAEFLHVVAENRGLSQEQLADRLVPTLGLDDPQALILILVHGNLPFASMKTLTRLSLISKTFARKAFPGCAPMTIN